MRIEFGKQGRIISGQTEGYFVKFKDDTNVTGGYYILRVNDLDAPTAGGDDWVKDLEELERFVEGCQWEIEWLE